MKLDVVLSNEMLQIKTTENMRPVGFLINLMF